MHRLDNCEPPFPGSLRRGTLQLSAVQSRCRCRTVRPSCPGSRCLDHRRSCMVLPAVKGSLTRAIGFHASLVAYRGTRRTGRPSCRPRWATSFSLCLAGCFPRRLGAPPLRPAPLLRPLLLPAPMLRPSTVEATAAPTAAEVAAAQVAATAAGRTAPRLGRRHHRRGQPLHPWRHCPRCDHGLEMATTAPSSSLVTWTEASADAGACKAAHCRSDESCSLTQRKKWHPVGIAVR